MTGSRRIVERCKESCGVEWSEVDLVGGGGCHIHYSTLPNFQRKKTFVTVRNMIELSKAYAIIRSLNKYLLRIYKVVKLVANGDSVPGSVCRKLCIHFLKI